MSYIGNSPISVAFLTDTFSGTGSQTAFTMTVAPANTSSIIVAVTGVLQDPSTYSVSGTTLTFSAAPPSGTSNISVRYLGIPASGVTTTAYRTVTNTTATAGQTSFTIPSYTVGYVDVYRNGVYLPTSDYTATTGTTVVLNNGATVGDTITTISFYVSSVLNAIPATAGSVSDSYIVSMVGSKLTGTQVIPKATLPTGSVLQVIYAQDSTQTTITSNATYSTIGLTATITPTTSTSKILINACINGRNFTGGLGVDMQVNKNGSTVYTQYEFSQQGTTSSDGIGGMIPLLYLDSPASTSALAYTFAGRLRTGNSGTFTVNSASAASGTVYSTLILMEIAA